MPGSRSRKRWLEGLLIEGYSVMQGRSGHYKIKNAEGKTISTAALTPSDKRSDLNLISVLRKCEA